MAATWNRELVRRVGRILADEAIVLLRNADALPLDTERIRKVAVIGPQADRLAVQGGGSAEVSPAYVSNPLEALRGRAGGVIDITHEPGCTLPGATPPLDSRWVTTRTANQECRSRCSRHWSRAACLGG